MTKLYYRGDEFADICVLEINNEYVTVQRDGGNPVKCRRQFNTSGKPFFVSKGKRYYEDDFVELSYPG